MTDLTGAELDLAVARVMGITAIQSADTVVRENPEHADRSIRHLEEFRPSKGGAAAWEVLEWAILRGPVELLYDGETGGAQCVWYPDEIGIVETAPNPSIALCRAVVALGEAG